MPESPAAVPAAPANVGVVALVLLPFAGVVSVTAGAPRSCVSTTSRGPVLPASRLANDSDDADWLVIAMLSTLPADVIDVTSTLVVPAADGPELAATEVPIAGAFV